MPTPTSKGQYRRVRYTDDGCEIYQCLWCLGTIEIRDDPNYGWHFCPKCGKSWFTRLQCRDHEVPRWYYDRYGNRGSYDVKVKLHGQSCLKEVPTADIPMYAQKKQSTHRWVIEWSSKWPDREWCPWQREYDSLKEPYMSDYKWIYSILNQCRLRHAGNEDFIEYKYRVRLEKIR